MDIGMRRDVPVSPSKDSHDHRDHDEDDRDGNSADESAPRTHKLCQPTEDAVDPPCGSSTRAVTSNCPTCRWPCSAA